MNNPIREADNHSPKPAGIGQITAHAIRAKLSSENCLEGITSIHILLNFLKDKAYINIKAEREVDTEQDMGIEYRELGDLLKTRLGAASESHIIDAISVHFNFSLNENHAYLYWQDKNGQKFVKECLI